MPPIAKAPELIVLQKSESAESLALLCLSHGSGAVYKKALKCTELSQAVATTLGCQLPILITKGGASQVTQVREIINEISKVDNILMSSDTATEWIDLCISTKFNLGSDPAHISRLNGELLLQTFVGHPSHVTAGDFVVFGSIYQWLSQATAAQIQNLIPLIRWFEFMQQLPGVSDLIDRVDLIARCEESKKKADAGDNKKGGKKDTKKENAGKGDVSPKKDAPSASDRPLDDPTRLEMKVGVITKVWEHPDADSLYCEEVDVGEAEIRKIASGLRKYLPIEKMQGAHVIVLANMKVKNLRGYPSHGMLLCASNADRSVIDLMHPPEGAKPGDLIKFEGLQGEHDEVLSTKKNQEPLPLILPHLRVDDSGVGHWKDHRMIHPNVPGNCWCERVRDGNIS